MMEHLQENSVDQACQTFPYPGKKRWVYRISTETDAAAEFFERFSRVIGMSGVGSSLTVYWP